MSGYLVGRAFYVKGLHPTLKLTLITLCDRAGDEGWCYAAQERMAEETEVSTRQVRRNLGALVEAGLIVKRHVQKTGGEGAGRLADEYFIQVDSLPIPPGPRFSNQNNRTSTSGCNGKQPDIPAKQPDIEGQNNRTSRCPPNNRQQSINKDARAPAREPVDNFTDKKVSAQKKEGKPRSLCLHGNCPNIATMFSGRHMNASKRGWCSLHYEGRDEQAGKAPPAAGKQGGGGPAPRGTATQRTARGGPRRNGGAPGGRHRHGVAPDVDTDADAAPHH